MAGKRDSSFPTASIGRTQVQGVRYRQENSSHDSLTTHPLLSPNASSVEPTADSAARYVPYIPRQRNTTGTTTTGTHTPPLVSVSSPQRSATSILQLQNLKAAVQALHLGNKSLGWAIIEKLTTEGDHGDWEEIWTMLSTARATLLLPMDDIMTGEVITPEMVKDHVAFCNGSANNAAPVVTLSGLRGVINGNKLTFRSSISPNSGTFQTLVTSSSRTSVLASLPPLPAPIVEPISYPYPMFTLPAYAARLPFPSRMSGSSPRPTSRTSMNPTSSLLPNPFASLFGSPRGSPSQAFPPLPPTGDLEPERPPLEIPAFSISSRINRKYLSKEISKAIKAEISDGLNGLPHWVIDRVQSFTQSLHPFPKGPRLSTHNSSASLTVPGTHPVPDLTSPAHASDSFQDFYESVEEDLRAGGSPVIGRSKEERRASQGQDPVKREQEQALTNMRIRDTLDRVESVVCALFYDRIFRPVTSDDASHDEALASRVAALNMLDLTFDHLGVDVGSGGAGVDAVVKKCGQVLQQLESPKHRGPAQKAAVLVAAHNVIVDGLSRLPPVLLKPDAEEAPEIHVKEPEPSPVPTPDSEAKPDHTPLSSPPPAPTPVASDILLPFIIFSVVKANPTQLISHLLYVQRFRSRNVHGEEQFCLINLMAAAEFLENVDLEALGLGDSDKVLSVADLDPLPVATHVPDPASPTSPQSIRGLVSQQVDGLAGSANKVLSGVVDSGFSAIRGLLAPTAPAGPASPDISAQAPWNFNRPGFGLLRRGSAFSIASVTSSLPGLPSLPRGASWRQNGTAEGGRQMTDVISRPGSQIANHDPLEEVNEPYSDRDSDSSDSDDNDEVGGKSMDARNRQGSGNRVKIAKRSGHRKEVTERLSVSDRLASSLSKGSPISDTTNRLLASPSRRTSLLSAPPLDAKDLPPSPESPGSPASLLPKQWRIAPPNQRFLQCPENDLRLGEVGDLLREYRRVVEALRMVGGFDGS